VSEELEPLRSALIRGPSPWQRYGFLRNPFPALGQVNPKVCHNQEEAKQEISNVIISFKDDDFGLRTLVVVGTHRQGKSNILGYFYEKLNEWRRSDPASPVLATLVSLGGRIAPFFESFHQALVRALQREGFLIEALEALARSPELPDQIASVPDHELRAAICSVLSLSPRAQGTPELDDHLFLLFSRWLAAEKSTAGQRKELGVASDLESASRATLVLRDFLALASISRPKGVVVFVDEFEEYAFAARSAQVRFLQDLRNFLDVMQRGIALVIASTPGGVALLGDYRAIENRLLNRVKLRSIKDASDAVGYAEAYLKWARDEFRKEVGQDLPKPERLLSKHEVRQAFQETQASVKKEEAPQSRFFDRLHRIAFDKVVRQQGLGG